MGPSPDKNHPDRRAKDFLAGASHELRTPLNAIVGMLELALGEHLPVTLRDYLTTAHDSARTLTATLDNLLDLARADGGRLEFDSVACELRRIVADALAQLSGRGSVPPRFATRIADDVPDGLQGDAVRLRQIVFSLAEYAMKCLAGETVLVEIGVLSSDDEEVQLELGVGTAGLGTPHDRMGFVPFAEADASRYSAAGLGLTVAQRWLRHLDGELWVDPRPAAEGRFYGTLRLARSKCSHTRDPTGSIAPEPADTVAPAPWTGTDRPLNVLVADDTLANQKVVKAVLTKRGHHVQLADNGRQAVEQLQLQPFDVVLMDAQMPAMNGLEATSAIRRLPDARRAKVPIIAMTAHAMSEDRQRCLAAGMDDYLSKPIDVAALIARVEFHGTSGGAGLAPFHRPSSVVRKGAAEDFTSGALARLGGDEILLHELIRLFEQDAVALVDKIRAGLAIHDAEAVARNAHNLKGLAANFDATAAVNAATVVERWADAGNLTSAAGALAKLETELDGLMTTLSRYQPQTHESPSNLP